MRFVTKSCLVTSTVLVAVRQGGSTWGSSVNYGRQFPVTVPGRYRVTWKLGATALGPALQFRLPPA